MASRRRIGRQVWALGSCAGALFCGGCGAGTGAGTGFGSVSDNHGHIAVISRAQLDAGARTLLNIQGTASHLHLLDLSSNDVVRIRNGQHVEKISSTTNGHQHTVSFN